MYVDLCRRTATHTHTHTHTATYVAIRQQIDVRCLNGPLSLNSTPRQLRMPFALKCDARDRHDLLGINTQPVVPKCPGHFGTGAELSHGHIGTGAKVSGHCGTSAEVSVTVRQFGTSAEMSWCRSVLRPKCPVTQRPVLGSNALLL